MNPKSLSTTGQACRCCGASTQKHWGEKAGYALLSSSVPRRAVKRTINAALSALGVGDTLKVWAIRDAGVAAT